MGEELKVKATELIKGTAKVVPTGNGTVGSKGVTTAPPTLSCRRPLSQALSVLSHACLLSFSTQAALLSSFFGGTRNRALGLSHTRQAPCH